MKIPSTRYIIACLCLCLSLNVISQSNEAVFVRNNARISSLHTTSEVFSTSVYFVSLGLPVAQAIAGGVMHDDEQIRYAVGSLAAVGITFGLKEGIKHIAQRQRPYERYPGYIEPYYHPDSYSMPSGHTALAFNTATTLTLQYRRWYISVPAYLWATAVGYSRINLGVHYPTDVLAGAALGALSAWATYELNKFIWDKTGNKPIFKNPSRKQRRQLTTPEDMAWY